MPHPPKAPSQPPNPARLASLLFGLIVVSAGPAAAEVSFSREIAPILQKRCAGCHGERVNLGGYRAHTFANLSRAGASGKAPLVAGKPEASHLFQLLVTKSADTRMPKKDDPLSPEQIALFRRWIAEGARFDSTDPNAPLTSLTGPRQHPAAPAAYRAAVPVLAVALAPGGREVAVGGYHEVTFWNAATGTLVRRLQHLPQRIQALAFSPDGRTLLVAGGTPGEYGEVTLVEVASGKAQVVDTFPDLVLAAAFSQDGRLLAAGCADTGVRVYEVASRKRLWSSKVHSDWVTGVSFSGDGRFLASSSKDMTVKVYEVADGTLFTTYNGHNRNYGKYRGQHPVNAVQFVPGAPTAVSAGGGTVIQIWDPLKAALENGTAADMEERFAKESHARYIEHGFAREVFGLQVREGQVFAASADGIVKQFDLATGKEVRAYRGHADWVFAVDFDSRAQRAVTGDYRGEVRVWDTASGKLVTAFSARPGARVATSGQSAPR
jgi:mono/diheme cytochrome c family protein